LDYVEGFLFDEPLVLVGEDGAKWGPGQKSAFQVEGKVWVNNHAHVLRPKHDRLLDRFLIEILNEADLKPYITGVTVPKLNQAKLRSIEIPLPPLEVQKEIVAEIEGYQKVIDGARAVLDNYRPHIPIHPDWPMVKLAEVCDAVTDGDHLPPPKAHSGVPFITISNINDGDSIDFSDTFYVPQEYYDGLASTRRPQRNDVLYAVTGSYGISTLVDFDAEFCFQRHIALLRPSKTILPQYLFSLMRSDHVRLQADSLATGMAQKTVSLKVLRSFTIPLPPLPDQERIVAEIEAEKRLVAGNWELVERFEKKIQTTLARVWGEDTGDKPK
jgi:restriction endonuclease S subunit